MIESIICWFFGHVPSENKVEFEIEDVEGIALALCERCDHLITFDPNRGWTVWG